jgi:RimJ/RimL family protein N-acetyltransferase
VSDWPAIDAFHQRCSPTALHHRWGRTRISRRDIERLLDYNRCWVTLDHHSGHVIALTSIGPLSHDPGAVDLGLQVADLRQRQGIGIALARMGAEYARTHGAHTLNAYTEASNTAMLRLLQRLGQVQARRDGPTHLDIRLPLTALNPLFPRAGDWPIGAELPR